LRADGAGIAAEGGAFGAGAELDGAGVLATGAAADGGAGVLATGAAAAGSSGGGDVIVNVYWHCRQRTVLPSRAGEYANEAWHWAH
jgi:hypothetical protein